MQRKRRKCCEQVTHTCTTEETTIARTSVSSLQRHHRPPQTLLNVSGRENMVSLFAPKPLHRAILCLAYLAQVLHDKEEIIAPKDEPVEVLFIVEVDVLPDGSAFLPHVAVLFQALALDLEPVRCHADNLKIARNFSTNTMLLP